MVLEWIKDAKNAVEILPPKEPGRSESLFELQVTTRSIMGAIVYESGGLLIDSGWLRVLGSGNERLPRSLPGWTCEATGCEPLEVPYLLVADDMIGGFFALDCGALGSPRDIFYFAPDTYQWENTNKRYPDFINFCLDGDLESYYAAHRWPGWREEISSISADKAMWFTPPLCLTPGTRAERLLMQREGRARAPVTVAQCYGAALSIAEQMFGTPYCVSNYSEDSESQAK